MIRRRDPGAPRGGPLQPSRPELRLAARPRAEFDRVVVQLERQRGADAGGGANASPGNGIVSCFNVQVTRHLDADGRALVVHSCGGTSCTCLAPHLMSSSAVMTRRLSRRARASVV